MTIDIEQLKAERARQDVDRVPNLDDITMSDANIIADLSLKVNEWKFAAEAMAKADHEKAARIADLQARVDLLSAACAWVADEALYAPRRSIQTVAGDAIEKHLSTVSFAQEATATTDREVQS